jgi:hemerythrin
MIIWDESMSTGDARLDTQHKMLIQRFNELSDIIAGTDSAATRQAAADVLDFLQFYASWHFGQEENCMNKYKCPIAATNKKAHAEFLTLFGQFYTQWQETNMDMALARQTHAQLGQWFRRHILAVDTQLRPCITKSQ